MPDDADPLVRVRPARLHRLVGGKPHREKLMVLRSLFGDDLVRDFEHQEVANIGQQPLLREQAFDEGFHRARCVRFEVLTVNRFPGRIPLGQRRPNTV